MVKRILGLILAMCMILDVMPLSVMAASDGADVLRLPTGMPEELLESDKAGGVFIMGTLNASVEEKGRIEVKIYRTGKSDEKASINLSTVDIGALYGKDYRIDDSRYDTDEHPSDKTLYEQSVTPERRQKLDEYRKSVENTMNYLSGNIKDSDTEKEEDSEEDNSAENGGEENDNADKSTSPSALDISEDNSDEENTGDSSDNEAEPTVLVEEAAKSIFDAFDSETISNEQSSDEKQEDINEKTEQSENKETDDEEDDDSSAPPSLASLKAAQTGLPTREAENADSDYDSMVEELIGGVAKEGVASFVDTSSETILTFEPKETEKTIIFEIMEDDESEGDEIFSIELSHPSENSELGQPARCVISIKDDEPKVHPKLSFTKENFQASGDGTATIRVKRDGAPYALCTATVETAEGSLSGLIFEPFEMEKTVNITATKDSGAITVKLGNLAGAEAGELLEATVNPPKDKSLLAASVSNNDGGIDLAAATGNTERSIDIKGADGSTKSYTLKYNLNDPMGTIYDDNGYAVGDFYFPNDVDNGGIWKYRVLDSSSATAHEAKYYPGTSDQDAYAHLKFYTPVDWEMGGASMTSNDIPFKKYSGFSIDWRQDSHAACKGGEIEFDLWNERNRGAAFHSLGKKTFKRCMSEVYPVLLDNNVMPENNGHLYINFSDDESTPIVSPLINCDGYVYGVAAFYRRYALNLLQPDRVSFRTAEGRYTYHTPAQAVLQIGHEERWQGQTATIMSLPASQEEGVYCYLDHYKITTGDKTDKKVTFEYYPEEHPDENGNIHYDSLPFNEQWFIDLIDKNTKDVTTDHLGYHTKLTIKPIYEQKEAVVRVFDGAYEGSGNVDSTPGGFTLDDLKPGVHVLKQGDEIDLRATPSSDNFFLKGTEVWLYDSCYNYSDTPEGYKGIGQPRYHATLWSDSRIMTYTLKDPYMEIKPIFSDSVNYIAVRGVKEGDIIAEELSKEEVKAKYKAISGKEAPDWLLKERIVALNPPVGELFNINIIQREYNKKTDYKGRDSSYDYAMLQGKDSPDNSTTNNFYSFGSSFDVEVKPSAEENTVWATTLYRYAQGGSFVLQNYMETVKIKGRVTTSGVTLLSSANYNNRNKKIGTPVAGAIVSAGGYQSKIYNMKKWREEDIIYRYTATTDEDGYFEIAGRFGCNYTNNISLRIDAGGMSTKYDLTPSNQYGKSEKVTYTKTTLNGRDITTKTITEDGRNYSYRFYGNEGEKIYDIEMPVASLTTPEPSHIWYEFTKPSSYQQGADTRNTSIPILDDEVVFSMTADTKGRKIKRAEFILNHEKGEPDIFEVAPDEKSGVFIWKLNMTEAKENEQLMNNDFLTVRLVDAEDETYTTSMWDSVTGETSTVTQTREQVYLPVHSGLSFSDVSEKQFVQSWEFESNDKLTSVPVFDNLIPNATSGKLNIKKKNIEAGLDNNPYVIQVGFDVSYGNKAGKSPEDILKLANDTCKNTTAYGLTKQLKEAFEKDEWDDKLKELKHDVERTYTNMEDRLSDFDNAVENGDYEGYRPEAIEEQRKKIEQQAEKEAKESISKRASENLKKSLAQMNKNGIKYKTGFNFVLADVYVWDDKNKEYVSVGCQYSVGASASVSGTHYWLCGGKVPLYIMLSGDFNLSVSGYDHHEGLDRITANDFYGAENLNNLYNGDIRLETSVSVQMTVGIGICNVLGARGYVTLKPVYSFYKDQKSETSDEPVFYHGLQAKISGGFSIDLVLFSIDFAPEWMSASVGNHASLPSELALQSLDSGTMTVRSSDIGGEISSFNSGVSLQGGRNSYEMVKIDTLLKNAPEHARPKIIRLDDGRKFLVFVANTGAETGSKYNGLTLMYSISSSDGVWSNPEAVDGNKTLDSFPMLYTDGKNVIVTWSDANRSFEGNEEKKDMLSALDVSYRIYDSVNNSWSDKDTLSEISGDLNFMDANPQISYDETANRLIVYYHKWDYGKAAGETDLVDPELCYNTIAYRVRDTETKEWIKDDVGNSEFYLALRHPTIDDPMVLDFSQQTKLIDGHYITFAVYTVDEDSNLQTGDDRDIYLFTYDVTEQKEYFPINLSNDHKSDTSPKINDLNGKLVVTWISDNTTLQVLNLENIIQQTKDNGEAWRFADYKDSDRDPDWLSNALADWTYPTPSENESFDKNSIYKMLKEGKFPIQSVNFSMPDTEDYVPLGYYQVVGVNTDNGYKTYVIWAAPGSIDADDHSQELYGAVYTSEEGWGETVKLTDTGKAIDNFSVSIAPDLSMTLAANCYEQSENSDGTLKLGKNSLVCAYLKTVSSMRAEDISVDKQYPLPGETCEVSVTLKNNGLNAANGYNVSLYKSEGKNKTLIGTVSSDDTISSGDSSVAVFEWKVPEDFNKGAILTAKCSESGMEGEDTANCYVPYNSSLEAKGLKVEETPKGLFFNVSVSNNGNKPNSATVLDLNKYGNSDKVFANIQVPEIKPGEKTELRVPMNIAVEDLGDIDTAIFTLNAPEEVNLSVMGKAVYRATQPFEIILNDGVKNLSMKAGETKELSVSLKPESLPDTSVTYSSSDTNVAKVDMFGNISALSAGTANITVTHKSSGISSVIKVTVSGNSDNNRGGGSPKRKESSIETTTTNPQTEEPDENSSQPQEESSVSYISPFTDIKGHWAEDEINYVAQTGLFKGTSETTFSPNSSLTRGMLAAVLYRYAGSPQISGEQKFTDVSKNAYYSDAVIWAESNGIIFGRGNGIFDPDSFITRQDFTAMLYRAASSPKTSGELSDFKDSQFISDYAREAMLWAVQQNILYGTPEGMLKPVDNVTRGETAAMITRFTRYKDNN